jgi:protein-S-isoprenylcysteine O-methyltransferase Ste14
MPSVETIKSVVWRWLPGLPWIVLVVYIVAKITTGKNAKIREASSARAVVIAFQVIAFALLFGSTVGILPPSRRFIPDTATVKVIGTSLACAGIAVVLWSRRHLGRFWSARITLKVDHQLIRSGPYARVRHPLYSGMLVAVTGTVLATGEWRGVVSLLILLAMWIHKMRREEALLTKEFGSLYQNYRKQAGLLFPRVR